MADNKDISGATETRAESFEKSTHDEQGRRQSTVAEINRGKNLDAK
jgi:hypothetical protein